MFGFLVSAIFCSSFSFFAQKTCGFSVLLSFAIFPLLSDQLSVLCKKYYRFFGFDRFLNSGKHKFSGLRFFMRFSDLIKINYGFAVFNVPQCPPLNCFPKESYS